MKICVHSWAQTFEGKAHKFTRIGTNAKALHERVSLRICLRVFRFASNVVPFSSQATSAREKENEQEKEKERLLERLDPDPTILHLTAVSF